MPLPDADKKSPRVYTLSQNTDLENMAFATMQSIGQPINIEELNEDELRRLVLVNLARLSVAGEWNGLLTAGGTSYAFTPIDASLLTTYNRFSPWDVARTFSDSVANLTMEDKAVFQRFVAPKTGTIGDITVRTGTTNTSKDDCKIAIYSSSSGLPSTRVGDISIDVNGGSGLYTSSSWATAPPLNAGDTYWIAWAPEGSAKPSISGAAVALYSEIGLTHYPGTGYTLLYNNGGTNYDFPSTVTNSELIANNSFTVPIWTYKYA